MKNKCFSSVIKLSACFVLIFSTFFITRVVSLSPFYLGIVLSLGFGAMYLSFRINKSKIRISYNTSSLIFSSFIYIFYILLNSLFNQIPLKYPILISFSILMYFVSKFIYAKIDRISFETFVSVFIFVNIWLLSIDFVYRFLHPKVLDWEYTSKDFFYMFKFSSIIFNDTNEVGFMSLIMIIFLYCINKFKYMEVKKIYIIVLFILLFLTFSRAALIGFVTIAFIFYMKEKIKLNILVPSGILVLVVMFIYCFSFSMNDISDVSLKSKFDIFIRTFDYLKTIDIRTFLFGIGYEKSTSVLGIYGHNYISLYIIEFGFVGFLLLLNLFFSIYFDCKNNKFFLLAYLITGLSYVPHYIPYFYILMGVISGISSNKKEFL